VPNHATHRAGEALGRLRPVASRQHPLVKELRRAFAEGAATSDGHCAVEGAHLVEEAIRSGLRLKAAFFSDSARERATKLIPQLSAHTEALLLPDDVFSSAVLTGAPQGVAALAKTKNFSLDDVLRPPEPLVVIAGGIQDPGNLGTMIRTAEAFGGSGLIATENTVNHFNPKVVRASAGSVFRLPIIQLALDAALSELRRRGLRLVATSSHKGDSLPDAALIAPLGLLIGNEGAGLPKTALAAVDAVVRIPHSERVDSLNAGVAAAVVLYEVARQRSTSTTETQNHREKHG